MSDNDTSESLSSNLIEVRSQKRTRLIELGIDPYPASFKRSTTTAQIIARHQDLPNDTVTDDRVIIAGRIYAARNSGMFIDLRDAEGKIQVFTHKNVTGKDSLALIELVDLGDLIGVEGIVRRTKRGELTVNAERISMLCKTLRPMPEKWHGLTDVENRYRKRYLDVMVNEETRTRLRARSHILAGIRDFMAADGFIEVETPMLHPVYGGATAQPFVTHHNALDQDMYLRIAPELFLKRVLVSGLSDRVFEVNRNFRNERLSTRHNPEFTMLEAYWSYADYTDAMILTERMFAHLATMIHGSTSFAFGSHELSFAAPFSRLPMPQAVTDKTNVDFLSINGDEDARKAARGLGLQVDPGLSWGETLSLVFEEFVEADLVQPVHVTHYPKDISPFAKQMSDDSRLVERFETYCNGWEICNAFSELNDPVEQRRRMIDQVERAQERGEMGRRLDLDFLEAMDHGMPPAAGLGIGVDRLIMLLTNASSIREVIMFPTLKQT
ncbi:MAG: lysine--tRNA ligase [Hyphomicrobiaceae bacterium]